MRFIAGSKRFLVTGVLLFSLYGCLDRQRKEQKADIPENMNHRSKAIDSTAAEDQSKERYEGLRSELFLGEVTVETRIEDENVFTEGPAVDQEGRVYFTNIPVNKILKWDPRKKDLSVFRADSHAANGLRFTSDGNLLVCEGGSGKVLKIEMATKNTSILAREFNGKMIQSPNDIDYDSSGRVYFTSRTENPNPEKENVRAVYRVDPDGSIYQLLSEPEIQMPNGIVISPDEKTLYLVEAHPDEDHARNILAFDLHEDGSISNSRIIYNFYPGRSGDGICIDVEGNLYVAAGLHNVRGTSETLDTRPGIHVISPGGKLLAYAKTPEDAITNCTFGGEDLKTLYVTCGTYLLSIPTKIAGKPSYKPDP